MRGRSLLRSFGEGASGGTAAPAMFPPKWATDEVPGISIMLGECCCSQDRTTAIEVAPPAWRPTPARRLQREKPPGVKYGTDAMCCSGVNAGTGSSAR
ncbi:hypothetical protein [Micromonospora sp. NPDC007230]|uniref:hypothetical protein n=1 Tax=Micromonospora sp. NPDC007230 TaxID=3364237 RepID=UPI00368EED80